MAIFLLLLAVTPGCWSCNARTLPRHRAKVVEEYTVAANLDENRNFPQLQQRSQLREVYQKDGSSGRPETIDALDDLENRDTLQERDLLVHHHHLPAPLPHPHPHPPLPHPPPPPPLVYAPSFFAIGLITFLLLLNSLQTSLLLILKSKKSVLGSVAGALGRRKRFVGEVDDVYNESKLNFKEVRP